MGFFRGPKIVTDGLVLALDAANTKSYPGSGTTWYDLSGNGNNGTLVNGVGYSGADNGSLVFDGVNDYVTVDYPALALSIPSMTVVLWIKTTTTTTVSIFGSYNNLSPSPIIFAINLNKGLATRDTISIGYTGVYIRDTANRYLTGYVNSPLYDGNWHCFVWRIVNSSANAHEVFFDGNKQNLVNTDETSPSSFTNFEFPIGINSFHGRGVFNPGPTSVYGGTKIYNRALTAAEIQQNYNALKSRFI